MHLTKSNINTLSYISRYNNKFRLFLLHKFLFKGEFIDILIELFMMNTKINCFNYKFVVKQTA